MPTKKVDLVLSNPWVDRATGKVHDVGDRVSVEPDVAERLVVGGTGVPATKSDAAASGVPDVTPASAKK